MSADVPEYYRHFTTPPEDSEPPKPSPKEVESAEKPRGMPIPSSSRMQQEPPLPASENLYRADSFTLIFPDDWTDKTVFTFTGPVTDGIQHNITVSIQQELLTDNLLDFAEWQIRSLEQELKGCRLLLKEPTQLTNGMSTYRAIIVWWPTEDLRLYQEQLYVLYGQKGYTLTASFTKKTRKTLGPQIERAMLSFEPV